MDQIKVQTPTKEAVDKCAHSVFGQNVLHDIAVETKSLKPSLNFVPWIVINGVSHMQFLELLKILFNIFLLI